jgi:hypothetical protein
MNDVLAKRFDEAMLNIYRRAKAEHGYNATYFLQMVMDHGGVETARRLVASDPTSGFTKLWELGRLDLTAEAHVLLPEFQPLFSEDILQQARVRLAEYGYTSKP